MYNVVLPWQPSFANIQHGPDCYWDVLSERVVECYRSIVECSTIIYAVFQVTVS